MKAARFDRYGDASVLVCEEVPDPVAGEGRNDGRFVLPQGFGSPSDFVDLVRRAMDELLAEGRRGRPKMISIGLHPR